MASSEITFKITGAENLRKRLKANNLLMTPLRITSMLLEKL